MNIEKKEYIINGADDLPISLDVTFRLDGVNKPVIIFSHGFKDFKDWGHYNELAEYFAKEGFYFIKFNFSHNGTTLEIPNKIVDLNSFANNNFTKELTDIDRVIEWVQANNTNSNEKDIHNINLIGHSRGGGISIIKSSEDKRINKLVTWGAPSNFENKIPQEAMEYWKNTGVIYVENSRTNQQMPLNYQIAEDYFSNIERINILIAAKKINIPYLIIHGTEDDVVNVVEGKMIKRANPEAQLFLIENTDHYFGIVYPYLGTGFTDALNIALSKSVSFLKS